MQSKIFDRLVLSSADEREFVVVHGHYLHYCRDLKLRWRWGPKGPLKRVKLMSSQSLNKAASRLLDEPVNLLDLRL